MKYLKYLIAALVVFIILFEGYRKVSGAQESAAESSCKLWFNKMSNYPDVEWRNFKYEGPAYLVDSLGVIDSTTYKDYSIEYHDKRVYFMNTPIWEKYTGRINTKTDCLEAYQIRKDSGWVLVGDNLAKYKKDWVAYDLTK